MLQLLWDKYTILRLYRGCCQSNNLYLYAKRNFPFLLSGEYCGVPATYRGKVINFASARLCYVLYLEGNVQAFTLLVSTSSFFTTLHHNLEEYATISQRPRDPRKLYKHSCPARCNNVYIAIFSTSRENYSYVSCNSLFRFALRWR